MTPAGQTPRGSTAMRRQGQRAQEQKQDHRNKDGGKVGFLRRISSVGSMGAGPVEAATTIMSSSTHVEVVQGRSSISTSLSDIGIHPLACERGQDVGTGGGGNDFGESVWNVSAGVREAITGFGHSTAAAVTNVGREISTGLTHLGEGDFDPLSVALRESDLRREGTTAMVGQRRQNSEGSTEKKDWARETTMEVNAGNGPSKETDKEGSCAGGDADLASRLGLSVSFVSQFLQSLTEDWEGVGGGSDTTAAHRSGANVPGKVWEALAEVESVRHELVARASITSADTGSDPEVNS